MTVEKKVANSKIRLVKDDITDMEVEAFVYDIRSDAKLGTGYGGAITSRAGKVVQDELDVIGTCAKGQAIITSAGKMPVKQIIHVNGPKFHEPDQELKLKSVTEAALKLANEKGIEQLAFPPIGTGFFQVDLQLCVKVMVDTVMEHLQGSTTLKEVIFVALDTREYNPFKSKIGG